MTTSSRSLKILSVLLAVAPTWGVTASQAAEPATQIASYFCDDPLPDKDNIVIPPEDSVPEKYAKFSGIWFGRWNNAVCSRLVFVLIEPTGEVRYVYTWGPYGRTTGGYRTGYADMSGGRLTFGGNAKFTFWMDKDGNVRGEREGGQTSRITMRKLTTN